MVLCNTYFRKEERKLVTYCSGGGKSAIDFIMVKRVDRVSTRNVRVILVRSVFSNIVLSLQT